MADDVWVSFATVVVCVTGVNPRMGKQSDEVKSSCSSSAAASRSASRSLSHGSGGAASRLVLSVSVPDPRWDRSAACVEGPPPLNLLKSLK
jgi:hypothetical protein